GDGPVANAPPGPIQLAFQDRRPAREGYVGDRHAGSHHSYQVVGADQTLQHLEKRFPDGSGRALFDVERIQEQHKDAGARIGQHRPGVGHGLRVAPRFLGQVPANDDALELLDLLGHPVLQDLKLVSTEVVDRYTLDSRIHVYADVVGFGPESRLLRLVWSLTRDEAADHGDPSQQGDTRSESAFPGHHEMRTNLRLPMSNLQIDFARSAMTPRFEFSCSGAGHGAITRK